MARTLTDFCLQITNGDSGYPDNDLTIRQCSFLVLDIAEGKPVYRCSRGYYCQGYNRYQVAHSTDCKLDKYENETEYQTIVRSMLRTE